MKGKKTSWSKEDLQYLQENFPHKTNKELAAHFNVGWRTIVRKARELNIQKAEDFRDSIDFSEFGKGNIPCNKHIKGLMIPGSEKGWFKKGNIPPNKDPLIAKKVSENRKKLIEKEKFRLKHGLPQMTKLKLTNY
jgi:hypothetical protein